jgi:hypothetical protein
MTVDKALDKSYVRRMFHERLQRDMPKLVGAKRQINARINLVHSVALDVMAETLGVSRSGLAADLIEAAIRDAAELLDIDVHSPKFIEDFADRLDAESNAALEEELTS